MWAAVISVSLGVVTGTLLYLALREPSNDSGEMVKVVFIDDLAYWQDNKGWHKAKVDDGNVNFKTKKDIDLEKAPMDDLLCISLALGELQK